jgi:tripartite-type tricarboxylate transporter receptor subunit TctC
MIKFILFFATMVLINVTHAQSWPIKPVKIVVPFPAGGALDTVARNVGQKLSEIWKQPVLIDNKPGAGGNIGADAVAKAIPDGHTLFISPQSLAISPSLYKKLPYDVNKDLIPVTQLMSSFLVLVVGPSVPANSFNEFVSLAKSKPGVLNYASTGLGSTPHLMMEMLMNNAKINITHIPYKGDAAMNQALLTGEVGAAFTPLVGVIGPMKSGKFRVLAITGTKRSPLIPDIPTITESKIEGFENSAGWLGIFAPSGTPPNIIKSIQTDFARTMSYADIKEKMPSWGYEAVGSSPEAFNIRFNSDVVQFSKLIKDAEIILLD